ncbi:hypothetical protein [Methyloradius palustris]|nr:hypothetical protein [Methyloradius palustris]
MSGAISAGAYTAGVFDFLITALDAWEKAREEPNTPSHHAPITAITGASAGGMTAVLGLMALGRELQPTEKRTASESTINCVLPSLYKAWVEQVSMVAAEAGAIDLLSNEDIKDGKIRSLLNSKLLDNICSLALHVPEPSPSVSPYAFLAEPLHVYVTLTNLRGIEYDISFGPNDMYHYRMLSHGDNKHYIITGIGNNKVAASNWAAIDPGTPLKISDLNLAGGPSPGWQEMCNAALGTGAFPVGLASRIQSTVTGNYQGRQWAIPTPIGAGTFINPVWPDRWGANQAFSYVNVDGGVINNDPFELARYSIKELGEDNPRTAKDADRAVIMVAPFPEGYNFPPTDSLDDGLISIIKSLIPTLIQQARFKPAELVAAAHPEVYSRFLISPSRDGGNTVSSDNIACGLLGGFGGFLDQSFREHDFQLGQRNCQQFLRKHFTLPDNNVVMGGGDTNASGMTFLPIIPLLNNTGVEIVEPNWPRMKMTAYLTLINRIATRADSVVPLLLKQEVSSGIMRGFASIMWKFIPFISLKSKVVNTVKLLILAHLILRDQIEDGLDSQFNPTDSNRLRNYSAQQRQILVTLAAPGFDLRTISGIANETGLPNDIITTTLNGACDLPDNAVHKVWKSDIKSNTGEACYTLYSRRLGLLKTLPLIGGVLRKIDSVSID